MLREMRPGEIGPAPSGLEQVHVEILQAFAIAAGMGKPVAESSRRRASRCRRWNKLIDQPWRIMTIGRRKWAREF